MNEERKNGREGGKRREQNRRSEEYSIRYNKNSIIYNSIIYNI